MKSTGQKGKNTMFEVSMLALGHAKKNVRTLLHDSTPRTVYILYSRQIDMRHFILSSVCLHYTSRMVMGAPLAPLSPSEFSGLAQSPSGRCSLRRGLRTWLQKGPFQTRNADADRRRLLFVHKPQEMNHPAGSHLTGGSRDPLIRPLSILCLYHLSFIHPHHHHHHHHHLPLSILLQTNMDPEH